MFKNFTHKVIIRACSITVLTALGSSGCGSAREQATIAQLVAEMNQRIATITRSESVDGVIPRFNQSKTVACLHAKFKVQDDIPTNLKQGIFAKPATYDAQLRFANATKQDDSKKDIRGLSIKLSGVEGESLYGNPGTQDFIFNSYPALFVATPDDFAKFIKARQNNKAFLYFLNPLDPHLYSLKIVLKARAKINSPFDIRYWSTTPFQLGAESMAAVKYSVTPCSANKTDQAVNPGENQFRAAMKSHLQHQTACFEFGIQQQTDVDSMPIENAAVIWDEQQSPFQTVATITIEKQIFDSTEALSQCEKITFNPWQSLVEHKPLGRMNEVRREVYSTAAKIRNSEAP